MHVLGGAATGGRLLIPASSPPQASNTGERYAAAPPAQLGILVNAYRHAGKHSANAAATLDAPAVTLHAPSRVPAAARSAGHQWREPASAPPITQGILAEIPQRGSR